MKEAPLIDATLVPHANYSGISLILWQIGVHKAHIEFLFSKRVSHCYLFSHLIFTFFLSMMQITGFLVEHGVLSPIRRHEDDNDSGEDSDAGQFCFTIHIQLV